MNLPSNYEGWIPEMDADHSRDSRPIRSEWAANQALASAAANDPKSYPSFRRSEHERYARSYIRERQSQMRKARQQRWFCWAIIIVAILALGLIGRMDKTDAEHELSHYCEMVHAYKLDSTTGWPDYRHIAATDCRAAR